MQGILATRPRGQLAWLARGAGSEGRASTVVDDAGGSGPSTTHAQRSPAATSWTFSFWFPAHPLLAMSDEDLEDDD